nr:unnamed protein product [Spirometra erinaceieuropaei]
MKSLLVIVLLLSVALADPQKNIYRVPMNAKFEYVIRVDASSSFSKSDSGFVEKTAEEPCRPHKMCVQFLPRRRSLQIYGDPKSGNARILVIPEDAGLLNIIVAIVRSAGYYPWPFSSVFTEAFYAENDYTDTLTLVFDKDIKDILLKEFISNYPKNTTVAGAEVFVPYEQINGQNYKLMRITALMELKLPTFYSQSATCRCSAIQHGLSDGRKNADEREMLKQTKYTLGARFPFS